VPRARAASGGSRHETPHVIGPTARPRARQHTGRHAHLACASSLIALIFLCLAWETWLAPLRPGGSWLMLKALPLLAPLRGVLHARVYTLQWAPMLILAYLTEGIVRGYADAGVGAWLGRAETALALTFFVSCLILVRTLRRSVR